MVKNKSSGGRPDMTGKAKKAGAQVQSRKESTLPAEPDDSETPAAAPETESQRGYSDQVYRLASVIFQNNHQEKAAACRLLNYGKERDLPFPQVKDRVTQRRAYELAFNALKYQELLEEIMIDSCFHLRQPMPDDQMSLVAVMLYDFQDRRFLPRERHEQEIIQEVRDVESYLLRFKTKLAASLARCRIKHDLLSIECILPESVRKKQQRSSSLPLYAWVNTLKSSLDEVQGVLKSAGFVQVQSIGQLEGQTFCRDLHCGDTLVFPVQLKAQLYSTKLLSEHKLIIQDKSCSLGPNAACSLLPEEGDVLLVGSFSGLTVIHTASLIAEKYKGSNTVYVCVSKCTDAQREELQLTVSSMGCNNVKLIPEVFQSLHRGDKRLLKVRVILLNPKCSVSAVSNPVEFILQENGDTDLLQGLSQGSIAQSKLEALVAQQREDIDHALKFPKVLAVVYSTCSSYPEENVKVVSKALQQAKACSDQEGEPKQASFRLSSFPLTSSDQAEATEDTEQFFTLEPSDQNNGCFLAILKREPEPEVKAVPQDVIARANAKGILDRIGCNHRTKKDQQGQTNRVKKGSKVCSSQPSVSVNVHSKNQLAKSSSSSSSAILCGHQDVTSKQRSLKGNPKIMSLQSPKSAVPSPLSYSKPKGTSYFSSSSPSAQPESSTPVLNAPTAITTSTTPPTTPPTSPVAPVVRPRRTHQEVLKPVMLVLPRINFPNFFPHNQRQTGLSNNLRYTDWKTLAKSESLSRSSGGLYKEPVGRSHTQF